MLPTVTERFKRPSSGHAIDRRSQKKKAPGTVEMKISIAQLQQPVAINFLRPTPTCCKNLPQVAWSMISYSNSMDDVPMLSRHPKETQSLHPKAWWPHPTETPIHPRETQKNPTRGTSPPKGTPLHQSMMMHPQQSMLFSIDHWHQTVIYWIRPQSRRPTHRPITKYRRWQLINRPLETDMRSYKDMPMAFRSVLSLIVVPRSHSLISSKLSNWVSPSTLCTYPA